MQIPSSSTIRLTRDLLYGGGDYTGTTSPTGELSLGGVVYARGENDIYVFEEVGDPPHYFHVYVFSKRRYWRWKVDPAHPRPQDWILDEQGTWATV